MRSTKLLALTDPQTPKSVVKLYSRLLASSREKLHGAQPPQATHAAVCSISDEKKHLFPFARTLKPDGLTYIMVVEGTAQLLFDPKDLKQDKVPRCAEFTRGKVAIIDGETRRNCTVRVQKAKSSGPVEFVMFMTHEWPNEYAAMQLLSTATNCYCKLKTWEAGVVFGDDPFSAETLLSFKLDEMHFKNRHCAHCGCTDNGQAKQFVCSPVYGRGLGLKIKHDVRVAFACKTTDKPCLEQVSNTIKRAPAKTP